jgi:uncharacterized membrane protein
MNEGIFVLGFVILIIGVLAAGYTVYEDKTYFFGKIREESAQKPYANLSIPLIIIGILVMIISAVIPTVRTTTKRSYVEHPVKKTRIVEREE